MDIVRECYKLINLMSHCAAVCGLIVVAYIGISPYYVLNFQRAS